MGDKFDIVSENGVQYLVCKLPLSANPQPSSTGRTLVAYTTKGFRRGVAVVNGRPLDISINATVPKG